MQENEFTESEETAAGGGIFEESTEEKKSFSHTVRHKDGGTVTINNYTKGLAIKLCCSECEGFESDPKKCIDKLCPLYPFKGGTIKNRSRADFSNRSFIGRASKTETDTAQINENNI